MKTFQERPRLRLLAVTVAAGALLVTAACDDVKPEAAAPTPSAAPPAATTAPAQSPEVLANSKLVCTAIATAKNDFVAKANIRASAGPEMTKIIKSALTTLVGKLNEQAPKIKDPRLTAAVADTVRTATAIADAPDPLKADTASFETAGSKLDGLCKTF
jgi:hypothetical protein